MATSHDKQPRVAEFKRQWRSCSRFLILLLPLVSLSCGDESVDKKTVIASGPIFSGPESVTDTRLLPLGKQFLESLKTNDVQQFVDCWVSVEQTMQILKLDQGIDWTPDVSAHYRQHCELEAELVEIYYSIYRSALREHAGRLEEVTLARVETTSDLQPVLVFARLPNQTLLSFDIEGAAEVDGRWKFCGQPTSLLKITCTEDGIAEMAFAEPTTAQQHEDLERVLGAIDEFYEH